MPARPYLHGSNLSSKLLLLMLGIALVSMSACHDDSLAGADVDSLQEELQCTESDLTVPGTCSGITEYKRGCDERDSYCVEKECSVHNTCAIHTGASDTVVKKKSFLAGMNCQTEEGTPTSCPNHPSANAKCATFKLEVETAQKALLPERLRTLVTSTMQITWRTIPGSPRPGREATCNVSIKVPKWETKADPVCGCQTEVFKQCMVPPPLCDTPSPTRYSSEGATLAQLQSQDANAWIAPHASYAGARCMTCDGISDPMSKYSCLAQSWSVLDDVPAAKQGPLEQRLVRFSKLLFELRGAALTLAARADLRTYYAAYPGISSTCGDVTTVPALPSGCTSDVMHDIRGAAEMCSRLLQDHIAVELQSLEYISCLSALEQLNALGHEQASTDLACNGAGFRDHLQSTVTSLLEKQLRIMGSAEASAQLRDLVRQLYFIDRWYAASADAAALAAAPSELADGGGLLEQQLSSVMGHLWTHARTGAKFAGTITACGTGATAECLAANASQQDVEVAAGIVASRGRVLGQSIVTALATTPTMPIVIVPASAGAPAITVTLSRPPMRSLPMIMLLGDALTPLVNDMEGLVPYHDMACQFRNCRTSATDTPSRRLWRILASLEHPAVLTEAVATTMPLGGWKAAFTALAGNQAFLASELSSAVGGGKLIDASVENVPVPARSLWLLLTRAEAAHARFESTGQFSAAANDVMHTSLLDQERAAVIQSVNAKLNKLNSTVVTYKNDLRSLIGQQLNAMQQGTNMDRLETQWKNLAHSIDERQKAIVTLLESRQAEDEAQGAMLSRVDYLKDQSDQNAFLPVGNSETFEIHGGFAEFTIDRAVSQVAFKSIKSVPAGRLLQVSATGLWMPTCALREQTFARPDGVALADLDLTNAQIGPEGYSMRYDGSHYSAYTDTHTSSFNFTAGINGKVCAGTGALGEAAGVTAEACAYFDANYATSSSESWPTGDNSQVSASFNGGMRLDNTPFPELPAGALLLVVTDQGADTVRNAYVVYTTGTSVLIDQPSDVYYVVNDKQCSDADTTRRLLVSSRMMIGAGAAADAAIAAMKTLIADTCVGTVCTPGYFVGKRKQLESQGSLLPLQVTTMHGDARQLLRAAIGSTPLEQYPPALLELFDNFVNHEILKLEREIQINNLRNAQTRDKEERNAMARELAAGVGKSRLYNLLPQWTLQDLDGSSLAIDLDDVLVATRDYLRPLLDLWYPHAIESVSFGPTADVLLSSDVDVSTVVIATHASQFVDALLVALNNAQLGYKPPFQQLPVLVISIPRPGHDPSEPDWRELDEARARSIWEAIDQKKLGGFAITPEDVYSLGQGQGVLGCFEATPVVRTAGVFVVREGAGNNSTLNGLGRKFQAYGSTTQPYATAQGPRIYQIGNGVWQKFDVLWRYGESGSQALTDFYQTPRTARPVGLSPFGAFELDFRVLSTMTNTGFELTSIAPATEIVLLLEVDSRSIGSVPLGIGRCNSAAP